MRLGDLDFIVANYMKQSELLSVLCKRLGWSRALARELLVASDSPRRGHRFRIPSNGMAYLPKPEIVFSKTKRYWRRSKVERWLKRQHNCPYPGKRYGKWTVLKWEPTTDGNIVPAWKCRCDCGAYVRLGTRRLSHENTTQCDGCRRHGHATGNDQTATYSAWRSLKQRCLNRNNPGWQALNQRGIRLCERWHKYKNFLADMGERPPGMYLVRRGYYDGYEPYNCCWSLNCQKWPSSKRPRRPSSKRPGRVRHLTLSIARALGSRFKVACHWCVA